MPNPKWMINIITNNMLYLYEEGFRQIHKVHANDVFINLQGYAVVLILEMLNSVLDAI